MAVPPLKQQGASAPSPAGKGPGVRVTKAAAVAGKPFDILLHFLRDDVDVNTLRHDESDIYPKHKNLVRLVRRQSLSILFLVMVLIGGAVFSQPIYTYFLRVPGTEPKITPLIALTDPNLTDQAVLSWVATSITEILTFGFGDIDQRIVAQRHRFTPDGWESFISVLRERNMRQDFKMHQLVLTTVPSNSPVIVGKGLDPDGDYTWVVEMPIVMTYTTNNNKQSGKRSIVRVTIARMPSLENHAGIGIKMWKML